VALDDDRTRRLDFVQLVDYPQAEGFHTVDDVLVVNDLSQHVVELAGVFGDDLFHEVEGHLDSGAVAEVIGKRDLHRCL
jgi:hypothetical protein